MKKFKVTASYVVYCHAVIEAKDKEDAYEIALNMDGGSFVVDRDNGIGDWIISSTTELREAE